MPEQVSVYLDRGYHSEATRKRLGERHLEEADNIEADAQREDDPKLYKLLWLARRHTITAESNESHHRSVDIRSSRLATDLGLDRSYRLLSHSRRSSLR
jgi:hypothetical protein